MRILAPLVELLAIKLFEHDHQGRWPVREGFGGLSWMALPEEDREAYRQMAAGNADLAGEPRE